jgi:hypothetical protein
MGLNESKMSEAAQQLQNGLALANRRMLEKAAALGYTLIIGDLDGGFQERPAAEVLEETRRSEWWHEHFDKKDDE